MRWYWWLVIAIVIIAGVSWYSFGLQKKIVGTTFCNNLVQLASFRTPKGEAGTSYDLTLTYKKGSAEKQIFTFNSSKISNEFSELYAKGRPYWPVDTDVPTINLELPSNPQMGVGGPEDGHYLINVFVDPANFSQAEFKEIGQCMKSEQAAFNDALSKTFANDTSVVVIHASYRFGGLTYSSYPAFLLSKTNARE